MVKAYKTYDSLKQKMKRFIPKSLFRRLINVFHLCESITASLRYGFPARSMRMIGVTGTNGKTTTCNLIGSILEAAGHTVGINSTAVLQVAGKRWDNDLSLTTANPFQLQKLLADMKKAGCDWVVMEVASHALVQHRVWGMKFEATVFTNLTRDHLDYHGTMEEYARAKGLLFANVPKVAALNHDDEWYDFFARYPAQQQLSYGTHEDADVRIAGAKLSLKGTKLSLLCDGQPLDIALNLPGQFNAYNAAAAAAVTHGIGIASEHIKAGLEKVPSVPGRMQLIEAGQDFAVIIDHAHTPDALENLFKTVRMLLKGRLITVIGADGDRDPGKREPIGKLAAENSQVVIVTDQEPYTEDPTQVRSAVMRGVESVKFGVKSYEIPDRREAIQKALSFAKKGDIVLIPGLGNQLTRGMGGGKTPWDDREVTRELLTEKKGDGNKK
jgi:UDP-N-acetylmuramoyl-L-alanyl-D-glutamate--2,6-diaminopimelate ligase